MTWAFYYYGAFVDVIYKYPQKCAAVLLATSVFGLYNTVNQIVFYRRLSRNTQKEINPYAWRINNKASTNQGSGRTWTQAKQLGAFCMRHVSFLFSGQV